MKLAFVFPPGLRNSRPLDFTRLLDDPRGTTGSEITTLSFPSAMAARGHDVTLFVEQPNAGEYALGERGRVTLREYSELGDGMGFEAVLSTCIMNDIDRFRTIDPGVLRVVFQQVNDFAFGAPGFDEFVDVYISPSHAHKNMLIRTCAVTESKWEVVPNGCDPDAYATGFPKVDGLVVYLSSPDRGLHLLLDQWSEIRAAVPNAELRIFYYALDRYLRGPHGDPRHVARGKMIRDHLHDPGVTLVGGVSRNELAKQLSIAQVLAYPASCLTWTEGFSCATLEGCASGALPIISEVDALGEIYCGAVPTVQAPIEEHVEAWRSLVIRALTVPAWADKWRERAKELARRHSWANLAGQLEAVLFERLAKKP